MTREREFMMIVRQALLLIVAWIERTYDVKRPAVQATESQGQPAR